MTYGVGHDMHSVGIHGYLSYLFYDGETWEDYCVFGFVKSTQNTVISTAWR